MLHCCRYFDNKCKTAILPICEEGELVAKDIGETVIISVFSLLAFSSNVYFQATTFLNPELHSRETKHFRRVGSKIREYFRKLLIHKSKKTDRMHLRLQRGLADISVVLPLTIFKRSTICGGSWWAVTHSLKKGKKERPGEGITGHSFF